APAACTRARRRRTGRARTVDAPPPHPGARWRATSGRPPRRGSSGARPASPRRRVDLVLVEPVLPEVHDVRPAEVLALEVDAEAARELLPVPVVGAQEL